MQSGMVWVLRADGEGEVRPGRLARSLPDNKHYVWVLEAVHNVHLRERQVELAEESMPNEEQRDHEHSEGNRRSQQNGGHRVTIQTVSTTIHISTREHGRHGSGRRVHDDLELGHFLGPGCGDMHAINVDHIPTGATDPSR